MSRRGFRLAALAGAGLAAVAIGALTIGASTPPEQSVTVPDRAGEVVTVTWTGTIPPGANATSDCNGTVAAQWDEHLIDLTIPKKGYDKVSATFEFSISWTPSSPSSATSDEILTVNGPGAGDEGEGEADEVGSSDGAGTTEKVTATNLPGGTYRVLACGFANAAPQPYTGTLKITTEAIAAEKSLPSANAKGLAFSAAVPADPQRDEAEPLIEIDNAGNIYTCGPTGFSNAADYAQVSTDGGKQFHLLGTPPRGQQGAGGGGDCALATGVTKNAEGNYQYAYSGLGALSGFVTATSPNNGRSIATAGADVNGGVTDEGALADRQWTTFVDDRTVLLSYNQQVPRNTVVQTSTDGGLTYSPDAAIAAPNPEFPGPLRYIPSLDVAYMPWTKGEEVNLAISTDKGRTWTECVVAKGDTVKGGTAGFAVADHDSAGNVYVVWADSVRYHTWISVLPAAKVKDCNETQDHIAANKEQNGQPVVDPGWSAPVQVDRDDVRTTVWPWVAAGGAPGRVAVTFYGTPADGDPNTGEFDAAWNVYVNQSLDMGADFSQVQATTHPFHYDSICLNGLACDLAAPPGDRSMADFFSIDLNPADGKLSVVFNRTNKTPDEALGHVAAPMVLTQVAGPSNAGGDVSGGLTPLRSSTDDAAGDALSSYSVTAPLVVPPAPPTANEAAADFTGAAIGPDAATGGFAVTLQVADLSAAALTQALADTGSQSLVWLWRFTNGYEDAAALAAWSPAAGFTFGFDGYTLGGSPCDSAVPGEKCQVYPGATPIAGSVDQATGTITLVVPRSVLRQLSGTDAAGRPLEAPADAGARFYDGTAFSLGNTTSATQDQQSFLYPLDSTPAMDFLLPAAPKGGGGGGGGGAAAPPPARPSATGGTTTTSGPSAGVAGVAKTVTHRVRGRGALERVRFTVDLSQGQPGKVVVRTARKLLRNVRLTSVRVTGRTAVLRGVARLSGKRVAYAVTLVDRGAGRRDVFRLRAGPLRAGGTLVRGNVVVR